MKAFILLASIFALNSYAQEVEFLSCTVKGNSNSITKIQAMTSPLGLVTSVVTIAGTQEQNTSPGSLGTSFEVTALEKGPYGTDVVTLTKSDEGYELRTDTLCNPTYMEEECMDSEEIIRTVLEKVECVEK